MGKTIVAQGLTPLLLQNAVTRTGNDHIPGHYCDRRHVWIINDRPIVESRPNLSELSTKTENVPERDDQSVDAILEMMTKTKVQIERDDEDFAHLLELATKTANARERDD